MIKEKQCKHGASCSNRNNPFACAFNHDGGEDIIPHRTKLTEDILCPSERPPFKRCEDGRCVNVHLEEHVLIIRNVRNNYYYPNAPQKDQGMLVLTQEKALQLLTVANNIETKKNVEQNTIIKPKNGKRKGVKEIKDDDQWPDENVIENVIENIILVSTTKDEIEQVVDLTDETVFSAEYSNICNA